MELRAREKLASPAGQGRELILSIQQGLQAEGFTVSVSQLCRWFGAPRPTLYYRPTKALPKVRPELAGRTRPRIEASPSMATAPNQRWATVLRRVWGGRDGWLMLTLVIDRHSRELLGWQLSKSGKATTAAGLGASAFIGRHGSRGRVQTQFLLRSGKWRGLHQPALHAAGPQLWIETVVHYAASLAAERPGRARHPDVGGAMRASSPL
ncbi:hypothetical protein [Thioalkalivibrio sp. XN279]|uniref:hypothetical protein n=1 Tax=Thioalkalivibrio sp. XN279 TaxID=2714953 RepID=UPI00197D6439|nr:hypothetical protein [Thioalkalivibrio sp. XN279]